MKAWKKPSRAPPSAAKGSGQRGLLPAVAEHCHSSPSSWWQQGLSEEVIIGLWLQGTIPRRLQCRKSHFFTFLAHHNKQNKSVT